MSISIEATTTTSTQKFRPAGLWNAGVPKGASSQQYETSTSNAPPPPGVPHCKTRKWGFLDDAGATNATSNTATTTREDRLKDLANRIPRRVQLRDPGFINSGVGSMSKRVEMPARGKLNGERFEKLRRVLESIGQAQNQAQVCTTKDEKKEGVVGRVVHTERRDVNMGKQLGDFDKLKHVLESIGESQQVRATHEESVRHHVPQNIEMESQVQNSQNVDRFKLVLQSIKAPASQDKESPLSISPEPEASCVTLSMSKNGSTTTLVDHRHALSAGDVNKPPHYPYPPTEKLNVPIKTRPTPSRSPSPTTKPVVADPIRHGTRSRANWNDTSTTLVGIPSESTNTVPQPIKYPRILGQQYEVLPKARTESDPLFSVLPKGQRVYVLCQFNFRPNSYSQKWVKGRVVDSGMYLDRFGTKLEFSHLVEYAHPETRQMAHHSFLPCLHEIKLRTKSGAKHKTEKEEKSVRYLTNLWVHEYVLFKTSNPSLLPPDIQDEPCWILGQCMNVTPTGAYWILVLAGPGKGNWVSPNYETPYVKGDQHHVRRLIKLGERVESGGLENKGQFGGLC